MPSALLDRPVAPRAGAGLPRVREPHLSCVVPCFNEGDNLRSLIPLLLHWAASRFKHWELVLVDDGSTDETTAVLEHWASPQVRALQLSRNFGKEAALTAGLEAALGDVVVMLDADLQHPPELIDAMLERWRAGADVVYAVHSDRRDEGLPKRMGARLFYRLLGHKGRFTVPADAGDFRLLDRAVVDALLALPERNRFMKGLYAWVGFRAEALPYVPAPRASGRSRYGLLKLARLSVDGIVSFTTWPLRLTGAIGLAMAALSFLYGGWLVVSYLIFGNNVSGWTTIVVCLLLFAGIQMISLGVLGEYVARIFDEVKHRPLYVVKRRLGGPRT